MSNFEAELAGVLAGWLRAAQQGTEADAGTPEGRAYERIGEAIGKCVDDLAQDRVKRVAGL